MGNEETWFEPSQKNTIRIGLPRAIQYSLVWTLFFSLIGIFIQSVEQKAFSFPKTLTDFFVTNYGDWFASFGNFAKETFYASYREVFLVLLNHWYYFFLTGGLISLIWAIISWLVHLEVNFRLPSKEERVNSVKIIEPIIVPQKPAALAVPEKKVQSVITTPVAPQKKKTPEEEQNEKISKMLDEGLKLLAKKDAIGAKKIYVNIKQEYSAEKDLSQTLYKKILDFYTEIAKSSAK